MTIHKFTKFICLINLTITTLHYSNKIIKSSNTKTKIHTHVLLVIYINIYNLILYK